ncbi:hypothetical protein [Streptomyces sp. DSS69]|uniref:hypothetical protein n=1 Tax=unclassified Streptomyces TaxID=2593676 RepID=UPI0031F951E4
MPGHAAPADTWERARAVLGPFLPLFATGSPGPAVASTADGMTARLAADSTVGSWLSRYAPEAAGAPDGEVRAASAMAGAVPACTQSYGSVSLEAAGQFAGVAPRGRTLLGARMEMPADAFGLE